LDVAYGLAREELARDPDRLVSVVLLTDGQNNEGLSFEEFREHLANARAHTSDPVRTFPILFGEASSEELEEIANLTGGRAVDGRRANLTAIFKEIRGYQ